MDSFTLNDIQSLVRSRIGLDANALGVGVLKTALRQRMQEVAVTSLDPYHKLLVSSEREQQALCQLMLVSESWMLRETPGLEALRQYLVALRQQGMRSRIRLLSAPSARGEEAISLLHIALESGFALEQIEVFGIDMSEVALESAREGKFTSGSFRGTEHTFVHRYFERKKSHFIIKEKYLERLHFRYANLLTLALGDLGELFDAVFCRNLLIYLGKEERDTVLTALTSQLNPSGLFITGAAESALVDCKNLSHRRDSVACAFFHEHTLPVVGTRPTVSAQVPRAKKIVRQPLPSVPQSETKIILTEARISADEESSVDELLRRAHQSANEGDLSSSYEWCLQAIERDPMLTDAYFLLGVLASAQNNRDLSVAYFKRVLYLEPNHDDALIQLRALRQNASIRHGDRR